MKVNVLSRIGITSKITKDPEIIRQILTDSYKFVEGKDYKINPDFSVDIFRQFDIKSPALEDGKLRFKIHKVDGNLYITDLLAKRKLSSLEGFPEEVTGNVNLSSVEKLKSLDGLPKKIGGDLYVDYTGISSLEGVPKKINGTFGCSGTKITSLEGGPREVSGTYHCNNCPNLTSLKGAPEKVGEHFDSSECKKLKSLEGLPEKIGGWTLLPDHLNPKLKK